MYFVPVAVLRIGAHDELPSRVRHETSNAAPRIRRIEQLCFPLSTLSWETGLYRALFELLLTERIEGVIHGGRQLDLLVVVEPMKESEAEGDRFQSTAIG